VGGGSETWLTEAFQTTQRVALIGPIGSGKSSMIEYVTKRHTDVFAPFWISVGHESGEMLCDPPEFARNLIRDVVRWARDSRAMSADERQAVLAETTPTLPTTTRSHKQDFSLKMALGWLEPAMGETVEETVADPAVDRSRDDFIDSLDRLVDLVRVDLQRVPVLILDDSDRWLRLEGRVREGLLDGFFSDTCRMLSERNWAVVMAIHPEYCSNDQFRAAARNGYFTNQRQMPEIDSSDGIRRLFQARIQSVAEAANELVAYEEGIYPIPPVVVTTADVFEEGFEVALYDYYQASDRNVRAVLTVAQQALQEILGMNEELVTVAALREAALALAP
jgi:hypothetical protein